MGASQSIYNITDIWKLTDRQLQLVLTTKNQRLSEDRNFDRTVVATILYNDNKLDSDSATLVEHPMFNELMLNVIIPDPYKGIKFDPFNSVTQIIYQLNLQYVVTVLQKEEKEVISDRKEFSKYFDNYFDELKLADLVFSYRYFGTNPVLK